MKDYYKNGVAGLSKKDAITNSSKDKKAVKTVLSDWAKCIDAAGKMLIADPSTRNAANAAKGQYCTWMQVVVACYPYQTAAGALCNRCKGGTYKLRKISGTASAYATVRVSVQNYIMYKYNRKDKLVDIVTVD